MDPALRAVTNPANNNGGRKKKKGGGFSLLGKTKTERAGSRRLIPFGNRKTPTAAAQPKSAAPIPSVAFNNADENRNPEEETMDGNDTEMGDSKISGLTDRDGLNAMAAASMARQQQLQRKKTTREQPQQQQSSEASSSTDVSLNTPPVFREERVMPQMVSSPSRSNKYKGILSHRGQPVLQSIPPPPPPPPPPREEENPISPSSMATRQMTNAQTVSPRNKAVSPRKYKDLSNEAAGDPTTEDEDDSIDRSYHQPAKKPITYDKVKKLLSRVGPSNEYAASYYSSERQQESNDYREPSPQFGGDPQEQKPIELHVRKRLDPGSPTKKVRIATHNDMELNTNRQMPGSLQVEEEATETLDGPRGEVDPPTSPIAPPRQQVDAPEDCGSPVYSEVAGFTRPPSIRGLRSMDEVGNGPLVSPMNLAIAKSMDAINELSSNFGMGQNGDEEEPDNHHDQSTNENEQVSTTDPLTAIVGTISRQIKDSLDNIANLDSMPTTECISPTQRSTVIEEDQEVQENKATISTIAEESSQDIAREILSESKSAEEGGAQKRRSRHDLVTNGSIRDKILRKKSLVRSASLDTAERIMKESTPSNQEKVSKEESKVKAPVDARTSVSQKASLFAKKYTETKEMSPFEARIIAREALRSSSVKPGGNTRKKYPDEISLSKYEVISELDQSTRNFPLKTVETQSVVVSDLDAPLITTSSSSSSSEFKAIRKEGNQQSAPESTKTSGSAVSGQSERLPLASSSVSSATPIDRYKIPMETPLNRSPKKMQPRPELAASVGDLEDEIQAQSGEQGGVELVYKEKEKRDVIPPAPNSTKDKKKSKKKKRNKANGKEKQVIAPKGSSYMKEKLKLRLSKSSPSSSLQGLESSKSKGKKNISHARSQSVSDEITLGADSASLWTDIKTTDGQSTANQDKSLPKKMPNTQNDQKVNAGDAEGPINLVDEPIDLTAYGSFEDLGLDDKAVWLYNISPKNSDDRELWQPESTDLDSVMDISTAKAPGAIDKYDPVSSPKEEDEEDEKKMDDIEQAASSCVGSVQEIILSPCEDKENSLEKAATNAPNASKNDEEIEHEGVVVVQGEDVIPVDIDDIIKPEGLVVRPEVEPESPRRSLAHLTVDVNGTGVEAEPHKSAVSTARSEKSTTKSVKHQIAEIEKRATLSPPAPEKFRHQNWKAEHPNHGLPNSQSSENDKARLGPAESMGDEPVDQKTLNSDVEGSSSVLTTSEDGSVSDEKENESGKDNFPVYYSRPSAYISPVSDTRQSTAGFHHVDALDIQLSMSDSRNGMETPGTQRSHNLKGFQALPGSFDSDDGNGGLKLLSHTEFSPLSSNEHRSPRSARSPRSPNYESFGSDGLYAPGSIDTMSVNGAYTADLALPQNGKRMSALRVLGFTPSVEEDLKAACTKIVPGAPLVLGFGQTHSKTKSKVLLPQSSTKRDLLDIIFEGAESFICGSNSATFEEEARPNFADTIVANENVEVDLEKHQNRDTHQNRDVLDCVCDGAEHVICGPPEGNHSAIGVTQEAPKQLMADISKAENSSQPVESTPSSKEDENDTGTDDSEQFAKFVQEEVSKAMDSEASEIFAESGMIDSTMAVMIKGDSVASQSEEVDSEKTPADKEDLQQPEQNGAEPTGFLVVDSGDAPEANPSKEVKSDDLTSGSKMDAPLSDTGDENAEKSKSSAQVTDRVEGSTATDEPVSMSENSAGLNDIVQDNTKTENITENEIKTDENDEKLADDTKKDTTQGPVQEISVPTTVETNSVVAADVKTDMETSNKSAETVEENDSQNENAEDKNETNSKPSEPLASSKQKKNNEDTEDTGSYKDKTPCDDIEITASSYEERAAKDVEEIMMDPLFDKALEQYFSKTAAATLETHEAQDPPEDQGQASESETKEDPAPATTSEGDLPTMEPKTKVADGSSAGSSDDDINEKFDGNTLARQEQVATKTPTRGAGHDMLMAIENGLQRLCAIQVPGLSSPRAHKDGPPDCITLPMGSVSNACVQRDHLESVQENSSKDESFTDDASYDKYKHHQLSDLTLRAMNHQPRYNTEGEESESLVLSESDVDPVTRPLIQMSNSRNSTFKSGKFPASLPSGSSSSIGLAGRHRAGNSAASPSSTSKSPSRMSVMDKLRYRRELMQGRAESKRQLSPRPVDADDLFDRYDNIVKQMVVSDHDRLVLAQERKLAESKTKKSPFAEDDEDDNDGLFGGSLIDNVSSKEEETTASSTKNPPGLTSSYSSSDQSSTPSEKARDLRRQLDHALKTSASIRTTQERLNTEMSSFKTKLQTQRKAALQEASSFSSQRRRARGSGVVVGGGAAPYHHPYPEELASSESNTTTSSSSTSHEEEDNVRLQQLDSIIHGLRDAQRRHDENGKSPTSSSS